MSEPAGPREFNPYLPQENMLSEPPAREHMMTQGTRSALSIGLRAWVATGIAGGIFGFFIFGFFGAAFGLFVAFISAIPVATVSFVALQLTHPHGVTTWRAVLAAAVCGAVTGFGSTFLLFGASRFSATEFLFALVPGILGAVVAAVGVALMDWNRVFYSPAYTTLVDWVEVEGRISERDPRPNPPYAS